MKVIQNIGQFIVKDIKRFEKEQKPVISYMVKEFEMKRMDLTYTRGLQYLRLVV